MRPVYIIFMIFFLTSCYKNHLYVQHEKVDKEFLASTHVNTPDPRQKHPPKGQRIIVSWDFPLSVYREKLSMILTVRFWDNRQDVLVRKIDRKRGYDSFYFEDTTKDKKKRVLTYRVQIINEDGEVVDDWKHQFWTDLIEINKERPLDSTTGSAG